MMGQIGGVTTIEIVVTGGNRVLLTSEGLGPEGMQYTLGINGDQPTALNLAEVRHVAAAMNAIVGLTAPDSEAF